MFGLLMLLLLFQRSAELLLCRHNRRRLFERGGVEYGKEHYPVMVAIHVLFYVSLILEYSFVSNGWNPYWRFWLIVLLCTEVLRIWVFVSLGPYWNTRIVLVPGAKIVKKGPYRFIRHPNYVVVVLEVLSIPMLCGAYWTALVFSILNLWILRVRIKAEEKALSEQLPEYCDNRLPRFLPKL